MRNKSLLACLTILSTIVETPFVSQLSLHAQTCSTEAELVASVDVETRFLKKELSGFFEYTDPGGGPLKKYANETWQGEYIAYSRILDGVMKVSHARGWVLSGSSTFSKTDFTHSHNKQAVSAPYPVECSYPGGGVYQEHVNVSSSLFYPPGVTPEFSWSLGAASGKYLNIQALQMSANVNNPMLGCPDGWEEFGSKYKKIQNALCELSDEFTEEDAEQRAIANATWNTAGLPALSYANDYTGEWKGPDSVNRTAPILFHAQDLRFAAEFSNIGCSEGEYEILMKFKKWQQGSSEPAEANYVESEMFSFESAPYRYPQSGWKEIELPEKGWNLKLVAVTAKRICSDLPAGEDELGDDLGILSLGDELGGSPAGGVIFPTLPHSPDVYSPNSVTTTLPTASTSEVITSNGAVRQAKSNQILADIIDQSPNGYSVNLYTDSQVGAKDGNGLYTTTGSPYLSYAIDNPDAPALNNRLRVTKTRGSVTDETIYTYEPATKDYEISYANGERVVTVDITPSGSYKFTTRTVKNALDEIVSQSYTNHRVTSGGVRLIQEKLDPNGANLKTSYDYYTDPLDTENYGRLKAVTRPDGSWESFEYLNGMVSKQVEGYLNTDFGSADNLNRVTTYTRSTLADEDGDSVDEELVTSVTTLLGQEIRRSYEVTYSQLAAFNGRACETVKTVEAASAGAAIGATGNLVTVTRTVQDGSIFDGRLASVKSPDGLLRLYGYTQNVNDLVTTVDHGVPNGTGDAVIDGSRSITTTDLYGNLLSEETEDIATSTQLSFANVTSSDDFGRPLRIDYADGSYETKSYACCGLESERSRDGITTSYTYDVFGNIATQSSGGLTTVFERDTEGRVLTEKLRGSDSSEVTLQSWTYDIAGRMKTKTNSSNGLTQYSYSVDGSGQRVVTQTFPDSGVSESTYAKDGSLISISGSAVAELAYDYDVDVDGEYSKEIRVGSLGETTEWETRYTDFLGRLYKTVYANGGVAYTYYDTQGRVVRTVDPDGVTQLFEYNTLGEISRQILDTDQDQVVDLAGEDEITEITRSYVTDHGETVERIATKVWTTKNDGSSTETISIVDTSLNGLRQWQTQAGLTVSVATTYDGSGGQTVTTTQPDGSVLTRQFQDGQLTSETLSHANLGTLSSTTYAYNPLGRLISSTDANSLITTYAYYTSGLLHTLTTPDPDATLTGPGYDPQTTTYLYDNMGRVTEIQHPDGQSQYNEWYANGQLKKSWGVRVNPVEYAYDSQNRLTSLTTWKDYANTLGSATTTFAYHAASGALEKKTYPDSNDVDYAYTLAGRLQARQWARQSGGSPLSTTYSYNNSGRLNLIDYSDTTTDASFVYDRRGRVSSVTDAAGTVDYAYHSSGQIASETYTAGLLSGQTITRGYDTLHRRNSLAFAGNTHTYVYDDASRLKDVHSGTLKAAYAYLSGTSLIQTTTLSNSGTSFLTRQRSYDSLYRVSNLTATPGVGAAIALDYTYNHANQRTESRRETGVNWIYGYDSLGQVTSGQRRDAQDVLMTGYDFAYTYDDIGNRKTRTSNGNVSTYTSNDVNQYTSRTVPGVAEVTGRALSDASVTINSQASTRSGSDFYYSDSVDNSATSVVTDLEVLAVKSNHGPQGEDLVGQTQESVFVPQDPESFTYDADGNLLEDGRWLYTWNAENRLIAMETRPEVADPLGPLPSIDRLRLEFTYDAQGRRIQKKVHAWDDQSSAFSLQSNTLFLYDGWNLISEETRDSQSVILNSQSYSWGLDLSGTLQGAGGVGGLLFAEDEVASTASAPSYDANGNVIAYVSSVSNAVEAEFEYGPFGESLLGEGSTHRFGFSTKYRDKETDLLYYGFRYYDPEDGRWPNRDPIEEQGGLNLYGMVGNDPVNFVDVLGLSPCPESCDDLKARIDLNYKLFNIASDGLRETLDNQYDSALDLFLVDRYRDGILGFGGLGIGNAINSYRSARALKASEKLLVGQLSREGGTLTRVGTTTLGTGLKGAAARAYNKILNGQIRNVWGTVATTSLKKPIEYITNQSTDRLRDEIQSNVDSARLHVEKLAEQLRRDREAYRERCM